MKSYMHLGLDDAQNEMARLHKIEDARREQNWLNRKRLKINDHNPDWIRQPVIGPRNPVTGFLGNKIF